MSVRVFIGGGIRRRTTEAAAAAATSNTRGAPPIDLTLVLCHQYECPDFLLKASVIRMLPTQYNNNIVNNMDSYPFWHDDGLDTAHPPQFTPSMGQSFSHRKEGDVALYVCSV